MKDTFGANRTYLSQLFLYADEYQSKPFLVDPKATPQTTARPAPITSPSVVSLKSVITPLTASGQRLPRAPPVTQNNHNTPEFSDIGDKENQDRNAEQGEQEVIHLLNAMQSNFNMVCNQLRDAQAVYDKAYTCIEESEQQKEEERQQKLGQEQFESSEEEETQSNLRRPPTPTPNFQDTNTPSKTEENQHHQQAKEQILTECLSFCQLQIQTMCQ